MAYNNFVKKEIEIVPSKNALFSIPIFKMFNEKSAIFVMTVKPSDGTLGISLAPSTLIGKTGKQSVVPKGTKVYDYSREVFTNLTYAEIIKIRDMMKSKINPVEHVTLSGVSAIMNMMDCYNHALLAVASSNPSLNNYAEYFGASIANFTTTMEYVNTTLNKINSKLLNSVPIYRKNEAIGEKKTWAFNYSTANDGNNLLYVSVTKNDDKASKIYIAMGEEAAMPLYETLNSYINNKSILNFVGSLYSYFDGETQTIKVAEYLNSLKKIYGENLELCSDADKPLIQNIVNGISSAISTNMFNSKNLRAFTGVQNYQSKGYEEYSSDGYEVNNN